MDKLEWKVFDITFFWAVSQTHTPVFCSPPPIVDHDQVTSRCSSYPHYLKFKIFAPFRIYIDTSYQTSLYGGYTQNKYGLTYRYFRKFLVENFLIEHEKRYKFNPRPLIYDFYCYGTSMCNIRTFFLAFLQKTTTSASWSLRSRITGSAPKLNFWVQNINFPWKKTWSNFGANLLHPNCDLSNITGCPIRL